MTLFKKKLLTSSLLVVTAVGVVFSQPTTVDDPTEVSAASLTFTITPSNFPNVSTSTASTSEILGSITVSGVQIDLGIKNAIRNTTGTASLDLVKNASALYNINPLPGTISSIVITQKTGQSNTLHVGSTARIINSTAANYSVISGTSAGNTTVSSTSQTFNSSSFAILGTNNNLSYFAFLPTGGTDSQIESIAFNMTVAEVVATNGQTYSFAVDLLATTDNKQGACTAEGLSWSTLETQYNGLTADQKTAFRTDTTDPEIVAARERYLYLRSFNSSLVNFASL
ncbi:MAG: hypothetical protein ACO207_00765 [Bacilli bacterium]